MNNCEEDKFWETVDMNKSIVSTWPEWKQRIVISAESASTGRFIKEIENE